MPTEKEEEVKSNKTFQKNKICTDCQHMLKNYEHENLQKKRNPLKFFDRN